MEYLRTNGWRTATVDQLLAGHAHGGWLTRTCALTFDDGFENFAEYALPVLTACGFSATVFIVPSWVGRMNDWPSQWDEVPRHKLLDWDGIRAAADTGMEIGGHSLTHSHLTRLDASEMEREIVDCKRVIQTHLGRAVQVFAYPYGETSPGLCRIVAANFRAGFTTRLGFVTKDSCTAAFERIDVYYLREPRLFRALAEGWLGLYLRFRRWLRDSRQWEREQR